MTYHLMDLPALPEDLIQSCAEAIKRKPFYHVNPYDRENFLEQGAYGQTEFATPDNFSFQSKEEAFEYLEEVRDLYKPAHFKLFNAPQNVIRWVRETIIPLLSDKYIFPDAPELVLIDNGNMLLPHSDPSPPVFNLNFIIWRGGNEVVTKFYEPKPEHKGKRLINTYPYKFDLIDYVTEVAVEQGSWATLVRNELHSVCNITEPRLILQIGITPK